MMDILLQPNVAYLLLVAGLSMAIMAVLTPGTGILEAGAVLALLLAGWGIYNLSINAWALLILLFGAGAFVMAVRYPRQWIYLALMILALVTGSAFMFRSENWMPAVNPVLALVVSSVVSGYFWVATRKVLESERARPIHDLTTLIGAIGEAKTNVYQEGSVQVAGELWSAYSEEPISAGARVRVVSREGLILKVEAHPNHQ
jgi:membrane-bound serine protease (ClpP class)